MRQRNAGTDNAAGAHEGNEDMEEGGAEPVIQQISTETIRRQPERYAGKKKDMPEARRGNKAEKQNGENRPEKR